jgi:hypothetical protein
MPTLNPPAKRSIKLFLNDKYGEKLNATYEYDP